jgi:hypothetical protein
METPGHEAFVGFARRSGAPLPGCAPAPSAPFGRGNVLFQDSVQLIEKMIQEGRDFGQAFYPQERHGFVRDETLVDAFRRTAEWMDRYLR